MASERCTGRSSCLHYNRYHLLTSLFYMTELHFNKCFCEIMQLPVSTFLIICCAWNIAKIVCNIQPSNNMFKCIIQVLHSQKWPCWVKIKKCFLKEAYCLNNCYSASVPSRQTSAGCCTVHWPLQNRKQLLNHHHHDPLPKCHALSYVCGKSTINE